MNEVLKESITIDKNPDHKWIRRLHLALDRDEIRMPLQTTTAVLLAFIATLFMSRENMSWGVFSALFVVQISIGGTVTSGVHRILGALLGAAIGVVAVLVLPVEGDSGTLLRLVVGVTTMSIASYRWPKLAYGLVTVTVIIVAPDFYVLEGAMGKIVAISIGSLSGMVAALAMFPVSSHRRADYHLKQALRGCSYLLEECMNRLMGEKLVTEPGTTGAISYHLSKAREITNYVYAGRMPIGAHLMSPEDMLYEVEYFRETLVLVDHFSERPFLELIQIDKRERIQKFSNVACSQIDKLAIAIGSRTHCEIDNNLKVSFEQFCDDINSLFEAQVLERSEHEHLIAIKLVWGRMHGDLTRLCEFTNEKMPD